jgi:transposase
MAKQRLTLAGHFSPAELKHRYLACEDSVERSHWQTIWLLSRPEKGYSCQDVADLMGFTADWVRKLVRRYNDDPASGLKDKRQDNGNNPVLDEKLQQELSKALEGKPPDFGLWSGPKVAQWIGEKLNHPVSTVTGWHYLVRLGWSLQVPRRQHSRAASEEEQEDFKKNSSNIPPS